MTVDDDRQIQLACQESGIPYREEWRTVQYWLGRKTYPTGGFRWWWKGSLRVFYFFFPRPRNCYGSTVPYAPIRMWRRLVEFHRNHGIVKRAKWWMIRKLPEYRLMDETSTAWINAERKQGPYMIVPNPNYRGSKR